MRRRTLLGLLRLALRLAVARARGGGAALAAASAPAVLPGGGARGVELLLHRLGLVVREALQTLLEERDRRGGVARAVQRLREVEERVLARELAGAAALVDRGAEVRDPALVVAGLQQGVALVVELRRG